MDVMPCVSPQMTVDQVLRTWQQTIAVFMRLRMACVGCPLSAFETLDAVAAIYGLPVEKLVAELQQAVPAPGQSEASTSRTEK